MRSRRGIAAAAWFAVQSFNGRSGFTEVTQPFKVRASCGHIVIRRMREATAGVPYTEDTIIDAPNGRPCDECEASR